MTAVDTRTTDWLAWRAAGIGASDIGAILGLSTFASPFSLWAEKSGMLPAQDDTPRLRIGRRMETVLAAEFTDMTGLHVAGEQTWITHRDHPWARATVDGFVVESPDSDVTDALGVIEFKTDGRFGWPDGIPANYLAQVRWQMACANVDHAWLVVMFAGFRVEVHDVARDIDDETFMLERAAEFWQHVADGTPPPVDGSDATAHALAAIHPTETPGVTLDADPDLVELLARRSAIKARITADEKVVKALDNELTALIGDAETIRIDGTPAWTYRAQTRATVDRAALESAHPDIAAAFTRTSTYRVLRPATKKETK